jgi:hypothetical protein
MKKRGNPKTAKGLITKTSDEKRGNPKKYKEAYRKDLHEKRSNPKNAKGLITKTSDEKRGNPKKCKGAHKKGPLRKKRGNPKISNIHTLIEASSADLTIKGKGDAFWFRPQITSPMKVTD